MTIDDHKPRRSTRAAVQNPAAQSPAAHMVDSDASFNSNVSSSEPEMVDYVEEKASALTDPIENVPPEIPAGIKKFKFIQPPPAPIFYPTEEEWFGQSPYDYINSMPASFKKFFESFFVKFFWKIF